ncbi:hypothetical protein NHP190002_13040 [Helicobacter ailurogastricus]|uniref:Uncharacterized protein n=1 Tax=Helicobacter ailurogastricus TaxID=1578720 RepID=A0A0K2X9Z1_9HELI|nr:hypothetical protein NHP190002_13040 [Helicobacter ailurogastricus]CRF40940.1 hypothetical protein HAL011_07130 [Helicobacter ailurogastricus]CRF42504.1 hypothetical protein HAL013_06920 [Helicobacter ailurogastricus]CRF44190.1 hypothetical protein HAL09_07630 [Helicobacter ailurogastricus]
MPSLKHTQTGIPRIKPQLGISEEKRAQIVQEARIACRKRLDNPRILAVYKRLADK